MSFIDLLSYSSLNDGIGIDIDFGNDDTEDTTEATSEGVVADDNSEAEGNTTESLLFTTEEMSTSTDARPSDKSSGGNDKLVVPLIIAVVILTIAVIALLFKLLKNKNNAAVVTSNDNPTPIPQPVQPIDAPVTGLRVANVHNIGARSGQQDSMAMSDVNDMALMQSKGAIAIVADGMGGLQDGDKVSSMLALSMLKSFHENPPAQNPADLLLEMTKNANNEVNMFLGDKITQCGSTLVAAILNANGLYWLTVGDSHIYIYRRGKLLQLNREHVHRETLDAMVVNGEITQAQAMSDPQRGALTSYIGMGRIEKVDRNLVPLALCKGDRVLLMSDGVFGTLTEAQIIEAMARPVEESAAIINQTIQMIGKPNQDNYTALIVECI